MRLIALSFLWGLVLGMLLTVGLLVAVMQKPVLVESRSPLSMDDTVQRIRDNAEKAGWVVADVQELDRFVEEQGEPEVLPVRTISLRNPRHTSKILMNDDLRRATVMLPSTIAVYEKSDGNVYVCVLNASLISRIFGGTVREVIGGDIAKQHKRLLGFLSEPAP